MYEKLDRVISKRPKLIQGPRTTQRNRKLNGRGIAESRTVRFEEDFEQANEYEPVTIGSESQSSTKYILIGDGIVMKEYILGDGCYRWTLCLDGDMNREIPLTFVRRMKYGDQDIRIFEDCELHRTPDGFTLIIADERHELLIVGQAESSTVGPTLNRSGVQLASREVTSLGQYSGYTGEHDMSDATISEIGWDLSRIVERPTLVTSFAWTPDSVGILYEGAVPGSLLSMALSKIPFESFLYWRGDVVLDVQVAASPMVQGILGMTFVPLCNFSEYRNMSWDLSSLTINPTVYIYANTNTAAELRIPFNHFQSYLSSTFPAQPNQYIDLFNNLGFVVIYVIEGFQTAGTLTGVSVSLFSHLENNEFKVPQLSSTITQNQVGRAESSFLSAESFMPELSGAMIQPAMEHLGRAAKSYMARNNKHSVNQVVDAVSSKALPSNFLGDALDIAAPMLTSAFGLLGMDNPTIPTECGRTVIKGSGNMNAAIGPEYIEKLAIDSSAMALVTPETFGTVTDEMVSEYLYRRYSYMGRFQISKEDAAGTILWTIPMSPTPTLGQSVSIVPMGSIIQDTVWFPLLSYLSLPYRYWTGGLRFKFLVSATMMHTCKIFVSFNYGSFDTPTTLLDSASQYGTSIEITQGSNEFEFSIPYVATQPYLPVSSGYNNLTNSMGLMHVVVQNELIAPDTVPPTISVAVFICGSDDFSYEFLGGLNPAFPVYDPSQTALSSIGLNRATLPTVSAPRQSRYTSRACTNVGYESLSRLNSDYSLVGIAESGVLKTETFTPTNNSFTVTDQATGGLDDEDIQIAPPQMETQVDDHFGVTSLNVRDLLKKYQLYGSLNTIVRPFGVDDINTGVFRINIRDFFALPYMSVTAPITTPYPQGPYNGLMTWAAGMYRQYKGALRIKVIFNMGEINTTLTVNSPFTGAAAYFRPGWAPSSTTDAIGTDILSTIPGLQNPTNGLVPFNTQFVLPRMNNFLTCLGASTSNVLEFEVPYSSPYLSVLTPTLSADWLEPYRSLGSIILTCGIRKSSQITANIYYAFADESRFGTLYRIPSVYVPAIYTVTGTQLTPADNVGFGTYIKPTPPPEEIGIAESSWGALTFPEDFDAPNINVTFGSFEDEQQRQHQDLVQQGNSSSENTLNQVEQVASNIPTAADSTSVPMNPHSRRKRRHNLNPVDNLHRKLRTFVQLHPTVNHEELMRYIDKITPSSWNSVTDITSRQMLNNAGIVQGKEGFTIKPKFSSSGNKNRRPLRRRGNTSRRQEPRRQRRRGQRKGRSGSVSSQSSVTSGMSQLLS